MKVALRANYLEQYIFNMINYQEFLNVMTIREVDLFSIDSVNIKNNACFNHVDFGNDENFIFPIKTFGKFINYYLLVENNLKTDLF